MLGKELMIMKTSSFVHRASRWIGACSVLAYVAALAPSQVRAADAVKVHVLDELPDPERGVVKLARYRGSSAQAGAGVVVVSTFYDEVCSLPCGDAVDVSERAIFFLVRVQQPVSYGFRIPDAEEVTLSVRPQRKGMFGTGFALTSLLLLPVGIPLLILGNSKVSIASGSPSDDQVFKKVKKAKI
jgi:hypothetical protein